MRERLPDEGRASFKYVQSPLNDLFDLVGQIAFVKHLQIYL